MTTRRQFVLASVLGAMAPRTFAQVRPVKVGMLVPRSITDSIYASGVVQRLAELGYRDGAGMMLEYRSSDGVADRFPSLARDLIDAKCAVIFAIGPMQAARALQEARSSVPVVFLAVDYDPVERGIVTSLRAPDRNSTGVYVPQNALVAKRMEIMREVIPAARRFVVFVDPFSRDQLDAARKSAEAAGVQLTVVEFSKRPYDYEAALATARKDNAEALIGLASPVFAADRVALAVLLTRLQLPNIGSHSQLAKAGFLLSLGVDDTKVTRRVAELGARILKGAKPSEIPVEQADEFELAINAKTARALRLKIPESVLARATRIVQ